MSDKDLCAHKGGCIVHALKGFLQASGQGLALKSLLFVLLDVLLRKGYKNPMRSLSRFMSKDTLRFSLFLGLMNGLYKASLCSLRQVRKKEDGLNHLVAGGISGLSIAIEDSSRKETWCLYLAARMIDISLRAISKRTGNWNVSKLEVWLFISMLYFLLYCFGVERDNMQKSYYKFLQMAYAPSRVEQKIMDVWCEQTMAKYPLNK